MAPRIEVIRGGSGKYVVDVVINHRVVTVASGHLPCGAPLNVIWKRIRRGEIDAGYRLGGGQLIASTSDVPPDVRELLIARAEGLLLEELERA